MARIIVSATGRALANASGGIPGTAGGGGGGGAATAFSLTLSHSSGLVGASETLTVTPNGTWPSGRVLAVTQSVALFTVGGFSQPSSGTTTPVVIPLTVNAAGGPSTINATDSGTTPLSSTGSVTYTATAGSGTLRIVQSFTLTNTNTSSSSLGFARQGIPFKKGDVPAGTGLQIRNGATTIGGVQFDERSTWTDGSLKHVVMHLRDGIFAASEARTYDVWSVPGASFDNTGTKTLADITGAHDFKVAFSLLKETAAEDDNETDLATVGSGSFTAAFNTFAATVTRVEKYHSGTACEGWIVWGMARDNTGGAADAHLKTVWYVDVWKTVGGTITGYEVGAVVTQDWWSIAGKKRRNYNAALMNGSTTIKSYTGVRHPYHSQWLTCETTGLQRGKRFWIGGAPTLNYSVDKAYWVQSKLIPPYNTTYTPNDYTTNGGTNSEGVTTYKPGGAQCHRYEFNIPGTYEGRGVICNGDATAFMRQTAQDTAGARLSALAGLHAPFHRRSNRTRTRPGDSGVADTANTVVSLNLDVSGNDGQFTTLFPMPSHDFTAQGMPTPVHAYSYIPGDNFNGIPVTDGFVQPGGKMWPYYLSQPQSNHRPNYSYYMYLVEGERYVLESVLDHGMATTQDGTSSFEDSFMHNLPVVYGTNLPAWNAARPSGERADPRYRTGPFSGWPFRGEERDFNPAILGSAIGIVPDAHIAHGFFKRWLQSIDVGMGAMLYCLPPDFFASGMPPYNITEKASSMACWMSAMTCCGHLHGAAVTESSAWLDFANHYAKQTTGLFTNEPNMFTGSESPKTWQGTPKTAVWHSTDNNFFPWGQNAPTSVSLFSGDFVSGQAGQLFRSGAGLNPGDTIYWMSRDWGGDHVNTDPGATPPGGITLGVPLYVKSKSGVTGPDAILVCSLTPGGADFIWSTAAVANSYNVGNHWAFKGPSLAWDKTTPGQALGGDSYFSMFRAVLIHAKALGNTTATQALVDRANTLQSTTGYANCPVWMYA